MVSELAVVAWTSALLGRQLALPTQCGTWQSQIRRPKGDGRQTESDDPRQRAQSRPWS